MCRVMLDAGHYGRYNRSPAVPEYWESEAMWRLHLLLKTELEKYGIEVALTRADPALDLPVYNRGAAARGCDAFFSLHSNAVGRQVCEEVDRPVVYYLADSDDGGFAAALAGEIADIMGTRERGRAATRRTSGGGEYYGVLRGARDAGCPRAFIVEHSFHTASAPARFLLDPANLRLLAQREAALIADLVGARKGVDSVTEDEKKRLAALEERVAALEKQCRVYHWYSELPDYARATVERLHKSGVFAGAGSDDMDLTRDMMRMMVILANQGVL